MPYAINGTTLTLQPTEGKWVDREPIGYDGNGRQIFPNPREFELKFSLGSVSDWQQLRTYFQTVSATGTITADLPEYGAAAYQFRTYSGCVLYEPTTGPYFEEHIMDYRIIIGKIIF